jgi:alkanesulfonate monooxygenase SsuD/methylene tetrahydromethanopterin reductase-like flavin-dependent oxidoreductase (luciferase family)
MRERVLALRALWTEDEPSYHGQHVNFDPLRSFPKPLQSPHPPVMLGHWGPVGIRHVIEYADEWGPVDSFFDDPQARVKAFHQQCEDSGRDPATVPITIFVAGQPTMEKLESYKAVGAVRVVLGTGHPVMHHEDRAVPFLDRYADAITQLA